MWTVITFIIYCTACFQISATDKQRLYDVDLANWNYIELAKQLNIKPTTAYAVIRRAIHRNGPVTSPRGGARQQSKKISIVHVTVTVEIIEEHPDYILAQIKAELQLKLYLSLHYAIF